MTAPPAAPRHPSQPPGTSPGALPGRPDDILLIEFGEDANTSLCALEQGACTPLASFTSTVRGRDPCALAVMTLVAQPAHPCCHCRERGSPGCWSRSCGGTWQRGSAGRSVWAAGGQQAETGQCVMCPHAHRSGTLRTAPAPCSGPVLCTSVSVPGAGVGVREGTHPVEPPGRHQGPSVGVGSPQWVSESLGGCWGPW